MSKFSLINVSSEKNGYVSGYWIQDHIGNLESANVLVSETNKANNNKLNIAIVEEISSTVPGLSIYTNLKRL
jgi:hypothetical protein